MKEEYILLGIVFAAIVLPTALWRRQAGIDADAPVGDWKRLPLVYKLTWRMAFVFETSLGQALATVFSGMARRYAEWIEISSLPLSVRGVFVSKAMMSVVFLGLGALTWLLPPFGGAIGRPLAMVGLALFGWWIPSVALSSAAQKRQEEIVKALPFAIDLIGSAMRAGLEFGAAMRYYAGLGGGGALEEEFGRVARESSLGKPIAEGLQDMAKRVHIKTFTAFAGVVSYGTEIGASIADTLKIHGAEMRRERFSIAEQKAARAPSVMIFPLAVFILPSVFLIIFVPVLLQFIATRGGT